MARLRVLLVDDARSERLLLRHALTDVDRDLEIREAGDAAAALALYQRHPFDLVFVDIRMPGRDGLSLCRELRAFDRRARIAVVSHYSTREHVLEARDLGAIDFLAKPFAPARLERLLARVRTAGAVSGGDADAPPAAAAGGGDGTARPAGGGGIAERGGAIGRRPDTRAAPAAADGDPPFRPLPITGLRSWP